MVSDRRASVSLLRPYLFTSPECSPLSCCAMAKEMSVNEHCLFRTFAEAKGAIDGGGLNYSEPGPFRVFAVYVPSAV